MQCSSVPSSAIIPSPTECEVRAFYTELRKSGKSSLLSIVPGYSDEYVVKYTELPTPLSEFFQWDFLKLSYPDLISKCESVFSNLAVTTAQAKRVEYLTRDQAKSKYWYRYRAGRVTASKLKATAQTKLAQPSLSLIKAISYPEHHKFHTQSTKWGCEHERTAREAYLKMSADQHLNLTVSDSGFIIHPQYPHLGATPDGCIQCDCCGRGVLEIKCPYSCRNTGFLLGSAKSSFCLNTTPEGNFVLDKTHAYHYQIQLQMKLSDVTYGDFVVWSESELAILKVTLDEDFITTAIDKATIFFKYGILPELLGKWYTKPPKPKVIDFSLDNSSSENICGSATVCSDGDSTIEFWCYCKGEDEGEMILCDNDSCGIKWFHTECLRITDIPKGKWFCPDCRKIVKKKK